MNITAQLQIQAQLRPNTPAIIDTAWGRSRITTFADLEAKTGQATALLQRQGLQQGDRVLVFYPMSAELYIILGALFRLGLVALFLDPSAEQRQFERCCTLAAPKAMIASAKAYALLLRSPTLRQIPCKWAIGTPLPGILPWRSFVHYQPIHQIADCTTESPALLTFTSGSTGQPKPVLRTHGFLLEQYRVLVKSLQLTPDVTELTMLPMFVLANLATGATTLIPRGNLRFPGKVSAAPILDQIQTHSPSRILASPAFLQQLVNYCEQKTLTLPMINRIIGGGAPMMPRLLHSLQELAPQAEITILYGSTEAEPIAHLSHSEIHPVDTRAMQSGHGLLVGHPIPDIQIKILNSSLVLSSTCTAAEFTTACLPTTQIGEIVVSGDHVLQGYWQGQGNSETKLFVENSIWHRTGDAGYLDTLGRLWLMGRCQACIRDQKGVLYPFAVECVVQQHPLVRRSAIIQHQGLRLLLIEPVHPKIPMDLEAIQQSIRWAMIDALRVVKNIPVDDRHNAKIAYAKLAPLLDLSENNTQLKHGPVQALH